MIVRLLVAAFFLGCGSQLSAENIFFDDESSSAYDHDRIGKYAARVFVSVCGDQPPDASRAALLGMSDWRAVDEAPPGVVIREQSDFANATGLTAVFRVGSHSCTLMLTPYRANARAADELAYGLSEALARLYGDEETGWKPTQVMTGLHQIDPAGEQFEQTMFLQWLQKGGLPATGYFASFDLSPDAPRVILGRRDFNGHVVFGMADSAWERRRNKNGRAILVVQGKDPVDTQEGGYNTVAITRNDAGAVELKAWMHIGPPRNPFRLRSALGRDPLEGTAKLTALVADGEAMVKRTVGSRIIPEIRARQAMLARGLYPVYLGLDAEGTMTLAYAEVLTLELKRTSGSEIRLQVPAGDALRLHLREHLGLHFD